MTLRRAWLLMALATYLVLACYQLELPGLHYDEAREAGVNAMEMLTGAPITAFRGAGIDIGGRTFPLMVQDYIGALNVYLSLPFLALSGIGVPNLRVLPVLCGLVTLLLVERSVSTWLVLSRAEAPVRRAPRVPLSPAGLIAVTLLAVSPSFIFWSRQGIFVTNVTQVFVFLCLWQSLQWWRTGSPRALILAALAAGLAIYAKLLAIWVIVPFLLMIVVAWFVVRRGARAAPPLALSTFLWAGVAFLAPLTPLLLFNGQSGGTFASIGENLGQSYYGVDNLAIGANLGVRLGQLVQVLRGEQFWYLGAVFANPLAPWLALITLAVASVLAVRVMLPPLLLLSAAVLASIFTVSDLFVTHFALIQPLAIAVIAVGIGVILQAPVQDAAAERPRRRLLGGLRWLAGAAVLVWLTVDLANVAFYHRALAQSGGLAGHSDAGYHLAYHLRFNGMGAPLALDWGMDAPIRYLSEGTVTPIEIFGYTSPAAPDDGFRARLEPFLANPDNTYLLHSAGATVFKGRAEQFFAAVAAAGLTAHREREFTQRDGTPLYEIWKVGR